MIVVIDYNVGNVRSVCNAFRHIGCETVLSCEPQTIKKATGLVLPGVAAFGYAKNALGSAAELIKEVAADGKPLLGICVGLQLLFDESEEMGCHQGLGILPGKIVRFPNNLTVPHMGWNQIEPKRSHPLLKNIDAGDFAYFAHSYYAVPANPDHIIACTHYGQPYPSVVGKENVCAIQFHPEKSQQVGLKILKNFVDFAENPGS